jgi:hypothetical protein
MRDATYRLRFLTLSASSMSKKPRKEVTAVTTRRQERIAEIANELLANQLGYSVEEMPESFKLKDLDVAIILRAVHMEYRERKAKAGARPSTRAAWRKDKA